jgi:ribose/xylose/arabinose/galactoside ABC-type transport system permease subunit
MAFFQVMTDGTLMQPLNLTNLILQNSYIVIMALGMLLVIVAGHIDLSVGSVVGFVGALAAVLMVQPGSWSSRRSRCLRGGPRRGACSCRARTSVSGSCGRRGSPVCLEHGPDDAACVANLDLADPVALEQEGNEVSRAAAVCV